MRKSTLMVAAVFLVAASATGCGDEAAATTAPPTIAPGSTEAPTTTDAATPTQPAPGPEAGLSLSSPAFGDGDGIPIAYTCDGDNLSPGLVFAGAPAGTTSLALTVIDPDGGDWVHWIVWNIPPGASGIPEGARAGATLPDGSMQSINDFGSVLDFGDLFPGGAPVKITGWDGPCPGPGTHRYVFTLYALTGTIDLPGASEPGDILAAIENARADGSLIDEVALIGLYPPRG